MRVGLVGCVKTKGNSPTAARDLYGSALFEGRRNAVEATCDAWYILSAKHGVIHPDEVIEPYDETHVGAPTSKKRAWSERVLDQLIAELGSLEGITFEIHAGNDYCNIGLERGIVLPPAGRRRSTVARGRGVRTSGPGPTRRHPHRPRWQVGPRCRC